MASTRAAEALEPAVLCRHSARAVAQRAAAGGNVAQWRAAETVAVEAAAMEKPAKAHELLGVSGFV